MFIIVTGPNGFDWHRHVRHISNAAAALSQHLSPFNYLRMWRRPALALQTCHYSFEQNAGKQFLSILLLCEWGILNMASLRSI